MAGAGKQRERKARRNGNGNSDNNGNGSSGKSSNSPTSPPANKSSSSESPPTGSPPAPYDGNRDPQPARASASRDGQLRTLRNMDLGLANSYCMGNASLPGDIPRRPTAANRTGKAVQIKLNTFHVKTLPTKPIYQYDIKIDGGGDNVKRGLAKKVWVSNEVRSRIGQGWIFDGAAIAYSMNDIGAQNFSVDMDKEKNQAPRTDRNTGALKPDIHKIVITKAKKVQITNLQGFLDGVTINWDNNCMEAMTFLDHLLREKPSQTLTTIKRSFYSRDHRRVLLGGGVEAMKGVYASMRPVGASPGSAKISVNADVANTTFWAAQSLPIVAVELCGKNGVPALIQSMRPPQGRTNSKDFMMLRRLRRVRVICSHRVTREKPEPDHYIIERFENKPASEIKFEWTNPATGKKENTDVARYMQFKYKKRIEYPGLPTVVTTKGGYLPMEFCKVEPDQRYGFKLDDSQTRNMMNFAVTLPDQRWRDIQAGIDMLDWPRDNYHRNYGLSIDSNPAVVPSIVLPAPKVHFKSGGDANPGTSGRWSLQNKKFYTSHSQPLGAWGVCIVPGMRKSVDVSIDQVKNFLSTFIRVFESHGGRISQRDPLITTATSPSAAEVVLSTWNATGNKAKKKPQLLVFIVHEKMSDYYERIKKSCDCRFGVSSQVLQGVHVQKAQAQYCSSVSMKVNAKLGGSTALAMGIRPKGWTHQKRTMIIGADVSHGAPGTELGSIAAITVNWDRECIRYVAKVQTNGRRVEMITTENWQSMLKPIAEKWIKVIGEGHFPEQVYYFRDGISEGQYAKMRDEEIRDIKTVMNSINPKMAGVTKYTALTCTKRHHVRFFPGKAGDKNGNALPGTLVQYGVTHPTEYDFYLCPHSAIKGTARPVHYYVLLDEAKHSQEDLQNFIYEASYQYVRSTTPVSLHPAIYYAHLAAARAKAHLDQFSVSEDTDKKEDLEKKQKEREEAKAGGKGQEEPPPVLPLIPMLPTLGLDYSMWFV